MTHLGPHQSCNCRQRNKCCRSSAGSGLGRAAGWTTVYRHGGAKLTDRPAHGLQHGPAVGQIVYTLTGSLGCEIGARSTNGLLTGLLAGVRVATWVAIANGQRAITPSVHKNFQACAIQTRSRSCTVWERGLSM